MRCYPVSTRITQAANDDAECAKPVEIQAPPQGPVIRVKIAMSKPTKTRAALKVESDSLTGWQQIRRGGY